MSGTKGSFLALIAALGGASQALTPVEDHGFLRVSAGKIVDQKGVKTQLVGMSLFWSGWAGQFYNRSAVSWLAYDWKVSVVRIAMGVEGGGNYLDSLNGGNAANLRRVDSVMQAAVDLGIYAIVDWHEENAPNHTAQAVAFFQRMAAKWGKYPNILYEIYNEPNGEKTLTDGSTVPAWSWNLSGAGPDIKTYSQAVVDAIRAIDTSNLILVGNENWDQVPSSAGADPVEGNNILYTLHFYAGSHPLSGSVGASGKACVSAKIPVFISEWGTSNADGGGGADTKVYTAEAAKWLAWASTNSVGWCNWSVVNKSESSAALLPTADKWGFWDDSVISASGKFVRSYIQSINSKYSFPLPPPPPVRKPDTVSLPGRMQAEAFLDTAGVLIESGADSDLSDDMGWIEDGDWADYMVQVAQEGDFYLHARVSSQNNGGVIVLKTDAGTELGRVSVPSTGGWQTWTTVTDSVPVHLAAGLQKLRLSFQGADTKSLFNVNWFSLDNDLDITALRPRASRLPARLSAGAGVVRAQGADGYSVLVLRDLRGRELGRAPVVGGEAALSWNGVGVAIAELSGSRGRKVSRMVAER